MFVSPFEEALQDLRISGSVMLHETYGGPWAIAVPEESALRKLAGAGPDVRVLPFHFVREGSFQLRHQGLTDTDVGTHEVAICPSGHAHVMALGNAKRAVPFADILNGTVRRRVQERLVPPAFCADYSF